MAPQLCCDAEGRAMSPLPQARNPMSANDSAGLSVQSNVDPTSALTTTVDQENSESSKTVDSRGSSRGRPEGWIDPRINPEEHGLDGAVSRFDDSTSNESPNGTGRFERFKKRVSRLTGSTNSRFSLSLRKSKSTMSLAQRSGTSRHHSQDFPSDPGNLLRDGPTGHDGFDDDHEILSDSTMIQRLKQNSTRRVSTLRQSMMRPFSRAGTPVPTRPASVIITRYETQEAVDDQTSGSSAHLEQFPPFRLTDDHELSDDNVSHEQVNTVSQLPPRLPSFPNGVPTGDASFDWAFIPGPRLSLDFANPTGTNQDRAIPQPIIEVNEELSTVEPAEIPLPESPPATFRNPNVTPTDLVASALRNLRKSSGNAPETEDPSFSQRVRHTSEEQKKDFIRGGELSQYHDDEPTELLHLQEMRISQHLRSLSATSIVSSNAVSNNVQHSRPVVGKTITSEGVPNVVEEHRLSSDSENDELQTKRKHAGRRDSVLQDDNLQRPTPSRGPSVRLLAKKLDAASMHSTSRSASRLDGPFDELVPPKMPSRRPSKASISGNYDETAAIWSKALQSHQDSVDDPSAKRKASIWYPPSNASSLGKRTTNRSSIGEVEVRGDSQNTGRLHSVVTFKPMEVEHTFDRLTVPKTSLSFSHVTSPNESIEAHCGPSEGRRRSSQDDSNFPHFSNKYSDLPIPVNSEGDSKNHESLQVEQNLNIPDITVTNTYDPTPSKLSSKRGRSNSSLAAWSRYPSHTREGRSNSAGILDDVLVRDFAGAAGEVDDTESPPKSKKRKSLKARSMIFNRKLFTDLLKPRNSGYRKGESGHRSSIAMGGTLEYPELELLPIGGMSPMLSQNSIKRTSTSTKGPQRATRNNATSDYSQAEPSSDAIISGSGANSSEVMRLTAPEWAHIYEREIASISPLRRSTDEVSPTDGTIEDASQLIKELLTDTPKIKPSSSSQSLPSSSFKKEHDRSDIMKRRLIKAYSAEPVRESTLDLCKLLEEGELGVLEKALKTAEDVWKD